MASAGKPAATGRAPERKQASPAQVVLAALAAAGIVLAMAVPYTDWWRERNYKDLPLAALEARQAGGTTDPIFLYWQGHRLNQEGRYPKACAVLEKAAQLDPAAARIRDAWAQALLGAGRTGEAFAQLKQFTASQPDNPQAHLLLGKLHITLGADKFAEESLREAVRLAPDLADAWGLLGEIQQRSDRIEEALTSLKRAVELAPDRAADHLLIGMLLASDRPREAEPSFRRAVALRPEDAEIRREFAGFLSRQGRFPEAEAEARAALALAPDDAAASFVLGRSLAEQGKDQEARPALEKAASTSPFDVGSAQALQRLYLRLGNKPAAEKWAEEYRKRQTVAAEHRRLSDRLLKNPEDRTLRREMARFQAKLGRVEDCVRQMALALQSPLDSPAVLEAAISDLRAEGQEEQARILESKLEMRRSVPAVERSER